MFSHGSGVLFWVDKNGGWVVTNEHVVKDRRGDVVVTFPDGIKYKANVGRTDAKLDLAWLHIVKPHVKPVKVAKVEPSINEQCDIAGYGSGSYLQQSGRLHNFVGSTSREPELMQVMGCRARQGDSGGPIFNSRGELVSVLSAASKRENPVRYTIGVRTGWLRRFLGFRPRLVVVPGPIGTLPQQIAPQQPIAQTPPPAPKPDEISVVVKPQPDLKPAPESEPEDPTAALAAIAAMAGGGGALAASWKKKLKL